MLPLHHTRWRSIVASDRFTEGLAKWYNKGRNLREAQITCLSRAPQSCPLASWHRSHKPQLSIPTSYARMSQTFIHTNFV